MQTIANNYVSQWQQLATSSDHQHLILAVCTPHAILPIIDMIYSTAMIQGNGFFTTLAEPCSYKFYSWGLSYNLYADRLLGLDLFPQSVYDMQNTWYPTVLGKLYCSTTASHLSEFTETYGVPLDTRHTYTKTGN